MKKIIIISLIVIMVLSVSAASAQENTTSSELNIAGDDIPNMAAEDEITSDNPDESSESQIKVTVEESDEPSYINSVHTIRFRFDENTTGNFSIYEKLNNENYTLYKTTDIKNNTAEANITLNRVGDYHILITYDTNYGHGEWYKYFDVRPVWVSFDESIGSSRYFYEDFTFIRYGETVRGNYSIYINGKLYKRVNITEEVTTITVPNVFNTSGRYVITAAWDTNYGSGNRSTNTITADNGVAEFNYWWGNEIIMYYNAGKTIQGLTNVRLETYYGHALTHKNHTLTYKIGKYTFKVKTDKEGFATFKIPNTVTPGKYTLKVIYNGATISKKLTVKQVLTLKTATVKKSAKKITLQATLKDSKPLKNKQITFKLKGKVLKAKTNSKGIAKVTFPKSVLKNVKVGQKVTYEATYVKNTVKKTAKVKR